jgi:hypothetical protein
VSPHPFMNESTDIDPWVVALILGTSAALTTYLVNTHRIHWWHSLAVWSLITTGIVFILFKKSYRYFDPHFATSFDVFNNLVVPYGLPSLAAIVLGGLSGWLVAAYRKK